MLKYNIRLVYLINKSRNLKNVTLRYAEWSICIISTDRVTKCGDAVMYYSFHIHRFLLFRVYENRSLFLAHFPRKTVYKVARNDVPLAWRIFGSRGDMFKNMTSVILSNMESGLSFLRRRVKQLMHMTCSYHNSPNLIIKNHNKVSKCGYLTPPYKFLPVHLIRFLY
jgi:hypothetical protein